MTPHRPGVRHTNASRQILDRLDFTNTEYELDIAGAQAYALLGIAEALGDIALSLRAAPALTPLTNHEKT